MEIVLAKNLLNWTTSKAFVNYDVPEIDTFLEKHGEICDLICRLTGETAIDNWDMQEVALVRTMEEQEMYVAAKLLRNNALINSVNNFLELVDAQHAYFAALIYNGYL